MNYLYLEMFKHMIMKKKVAWNWQGPVSYLYGKNKPFQFQGEKWLGMIRNNENWE